MIQRREAMDSVMADAAGASQACENLLQSLKRWQELAKSIAPATTAPSTKDDPWAVLALASTEVPTRPSPPLAQPTTDAGHAVHPCGCALVHPSGRGQLTISLSVTQGEVMVHCPVHNVSRWYALTPVPAVSQEPSTSVKQDSSSSVEASTVAGAMSASSERNERCYYQSLKTKRFCLLDKGHYGFHEYTP